MIKLLTNINPTLRYTLIIKFILAVRNNNEYVIIITYLAPRYRNHDPFHATIVSDRVRFLIHLSAFQSVTQLHRGHKYHFSAVNSTLLCYDTTVFFYNRRFAETNIYDIFT